MNAGVLLDDASARELEFRWLREALAPASAYGERIFQELRPFVPGEEAAASARAGAIAALAAAADESRLDAIREVFRSVPDAANAVARASMGDLLGDANLLELQRFFDACVRLDGLTESLPGVERTVNESLRACSRGLELGRAGKFGFYLSDAFDEGLARARASLASAQAEYDAAVGRAGARIGQALGRDISSNEFTVMRVDLDGPLPPGVRVLREGPTYLLCEIDADEATLAALERRDAFAAAVASAEERVRAGLTSLVRAHAAALDAVARIFGEIDVLVAAARFSRSNGCVAAAIVAAPELRFTEGCFVPLALELEREGRRFTKISVELHDVAALTGPNMGGKSVCLRTCGFIAICAAFGIPVPAASATCSLFAEVAWLGVGAEERGGLLSSFAREVVRLREVLERNRRPLFVMLDEFARTTTPLEGRALLVAVLRRLRALGACGLAATHLAGVAGAAQTRHFAVRGLRDIPKRPPAGDLASALETLAASMDYTLVEVTDETPARSDALALAALLGLDREIVDDAYASLELPE